MQVTHRQLLVEPWEYLQVGTLVSLSHPWEWILADLGVGFGEHEYLLKHTCITCAGKYQHINMDDKLSSLSHIHTIMY